MGKYDLIQPLVETVDRRGQQYELGRAGASSSDLGNLITGFQQSRAQATQTGIAQLAAQEKYNPTALARDALKKDIQNKLLDQALEQSRLSNQIFRETGLEQAEESINEQKARVALNKANAARVAEITRVSKTKGAEVARAAVAAKDISTARKQTAEARALDITSAINEKFGGMTAKSEALERIGTASEKLGLNDSTGGASKAKGYGGFISDPGVIAPVEATPATQSPVQKALNDFITQEVLGEDLSQEADLKRATYEKQLANDRLRINNATNDLVSTEYLPAISTAANDAIEGKPNVSSGLESITKIAESLANATNEEDIKFRANALQKAIKEFGGADVLLKGIDAEIADPHQRDLAKQPIFKALSFGNPDNLPSEQREILNAFSGLGKNKAATMTQDPKAVYDNMGKMISNQASLVDDANFKRATRNNDYVIAARLASKNGSQPFTVSSGHASSPTEQGPDIAAGQTGGAQTVTIFEGADGTVAYAPNPGNDDAAHGMISVMEEVSKRTGDQLRATQQTKQAIGDIQARQRRMSAAAQPQQAPKTLEQQAASQGADIVVPEGTPTAQAAPSVTTPAEAERSLVSEDLIEQSTFPSTVYEGAARAQRKSVKQGGRGLSDKIAESMGETEFKARATFQTAQQKSAEAERKAATTSNKWYRDLHELTNLVKSSPKYAEVLGTQGKSTRNIANLLSEVPVLSKLVDPGVARILELGQQLEGAAIMAAISGGATARTIDTEKERLAMASIMSSLGNNAFDIEDAMKLVHTEAKLQEGIAQIREQSVALDLSAGFTNGLIREYSKNNRAYWFDDTGHLVEQAGDSAQDGYSFMSQNAIVKELQRRQDRLYGFGSGQAAQPPTSTTPTSTVEDNDTVTPAAATGGEGATPLPSPASPEGGVPSVETPETSTLGTSTAATTTEGVVPLGGVTTTRTTTGDSESGGVINFVQDMYSRASQAYGDYKQSEQDKLVSERAKQDPAYRNTVDEIKAKFKEMGHEPSDFEFIADRMTLGAASEIAATAGETTADVVSWLTGGESKVSKAFRVPRAMKELLEERAAQSPGETLAADAIAFTVLSGAIKAAGVSALGKVAEKVPALKNSIEFLLGATKAEDLSTAALYAQKTAQVAGRAIPDAATTALITDEGTIEERLATGAVASAGAQVLFGVGGKVLSGGFRYFKNLLGKPDEVTELARLFAAKGVTGAKGKLDRLAKEAAELSDDEFKASILSTFEGAEREVIEEVFASPAGQTALELARPGIKKGISASREAARKPVEKLKLPSTESVQEQFADDVAQQADELIANATTKAEATQIEAVKSITGESGITKDAQQALNKMSILGKTKAPKIKQSLISKDVDFVQAAETRMTNLQTTAEVVDKALKGPKSAFKQLEQEFSSDFGKASVAKLQKDLTTKYGKTKVNKMLAPIDEALVGVKTAGVTPGKISTAKPKVTLATTTKQAAKEEAKAATKEVSRKIQPTFKYLAEFREFVDKGGDAITAIGTDQRKDIVKLINNTISESLKEVGEDAGTYRSLIKEYAKAINVRDKALKQSDVLKTVAFKLRDPKREGSLYNAVFKDTKEEDLIKLAYGKEGTHQLRSKLQAYDKAFDDLGALAEGKLSTKAQKIAGISADLEKGLTLTGAERSIGFKLLDAAREGKNPEVPKKIYNSVSDKNKPLVSESIAQAIDTKAKNWLTKNSDKLVGKESFKPASMLGIDKSQWITLKGMLGKEKTDILESYFDRTVSINNLESLLSTGSKMPKNNISGFVNSFLRRFIETDGRSLLDMTTGQAFARLTKRQQMAIAKGLTGGTDDVNKLIQDVAAVIETQSTLAGPEAVLRSSDLKKEALETARRIALGAWISEADTEAKDQARYTELQRKGRSKSLKELLAQEWVTQPQD